MIEIALQVGCSSQSNFTTIFRKYAGITPKAYREMI
ncbi:MAG: AraC family transcriptional regulator [Nostoc sp. C3-bin3]|nr:AraC family transcriptional regulator [Nostoc sp. C3-bin3]